jgi:hypothetical protein
MSEDPIFYPNYQIAVGNDNAAGLATLEGTVAAGASKPFPPVTNFQFVDPGEFRIRANGTLFVSGFISLTWRLDGGIDAVMEKYLRDTYCSSRYSGLVTIKTDIETNGTYANYNAVMYLPKRAEAGIIDGSLIFTPYNIRFVRVEAL